MSEEQELSTREAIDAIEAGVRSLRAFEQVGKALRKLEVLEQSIKESEDRLKRSKENESTQGNRGAIAEAAIKDNLAKAASIQKAAQDDADTLRNDAVTDRKRILDAAFVEAGDMKKQAQQDHDDLVKRGAGLRMEHETLTNSVNARKKELEIVTKALTDHREKMAAFLKG